MYFHNQNSPTKHPQDTYSVLSRKMMARHLDWVHWTLGILRDLQAFFWLQVFSALE
jgi:hypothetical protein